MKAIINNVLTSGNEVAADRGYYAKRPNGRLVISQKALRAAERLRARYELVTSFISDGLKKGADVEPGEFDAGIFNEPAKKPNWREEFVKLGGDPKKVNDETPKQDNHRIRVFKAGEKQKGTRLAPTANGEPVAPPVKAVKDAEAAE